MKVPDGTPLAIRAAREERGWSQAELARRAGTSQQTVDRVERGEVSYSRALPDLIAALDMSAEDRPSGDTRGSSPPRPSGSEGNGATLSIKNSRIRLTIDEELSISAAQRILAIIEEDRA